MKLSKISDNASLKHPLPYVFKIGLKSVYPIYSVDLTNQPQNISNVKSNVLRNVDFNKAVWDPSGCAEGTIWYIVVVSNCFLRYKPEKNKIAQVKWIQFL